VTTLERPDLYVLARFLDKMYDNHLPLKKTNLQMRVGLNYPRFMEYLEWLISHGLIQRTMDDEGTEVYSLSSQGVDAHRRLVAWIRETMKGMRI
jgi:predicted transcriptional regulator